MLDPFPKVSGQGAARLREAGIAFEVGVGELAARGVNAPYLKLLRGKSWVVAKWAMTLDGKIATAAGESKWITGEAARRRVHELRGMMDAILVGRGTLLADDPLLTARPAGPRTPTRIVMTTTGDGMDGDCNLLKTIQDAPALIAAPSAVHSKLRKWKEAGAELLAVDSVPQLLELLAARRMTNVLVEGGAGVLGSFLAAGEIDEVYAFVAAKLVGGSNAPTPIAGAGITSLAKALQLTDLCVETIGDDILIHGRK